MYLEIQDVLSRKVILYIATSLDGYIAKPKDDLSFLSIVEKPGEDYGYGSFIQSVDTVILGRKTYDWVMRQVPVFPHAEKTTYVITRSARPAVGNTRFYTGRPEELLKSVKQEEGKNIFIDGGAELADTLLKSDLIDEFIISIIPVLLGEGIRLFKDGRPEQRLELVSVKSFEKGLVQLHYQRKHN